MVRQQYTEDVANEIVQARDIENLSWAQIAETYQIDRRTVKKWYERYKGTEEVASYVKNNSSRFISSRFQPLERTGDCLITSDWHIPLHDSSLVNKLIDTAKYYDIKQLIINGDFFNLDTFSHYLPHQPEAEFSIERADATEIMNALLEQFDEIDFTWGNHDFRITKFLDFKLSFEYCMRWILSDVKDLDRVRISDLDYMYYKTSERTYRVCHQGNFSKAPLNVPRQLAMKYGMSIISAHCHHLAIGVALDGFNHIIDNGGLFDKTKTEYIQKTSTHHEWVPGFVGFKDEVPLLFSPVFGNL